MGKRGKGKKQGNKNSKRRLRDEDVNPADMDDEIDACKIFFFKRIVFVIFYAVHRLHVHFLFIYLPHYLLQFTSKGMLFLWM